MFPVCVCVRCPPTFLLLCYDWHPRSKSTVNRRRHPRCAAISALLAVFFALTEIAAPSQRLKRSPKWRTLHARLMPSHLLAILPARTNARWCSVSSPCIIWALTSVRAGQTKPSKTKSSPERGRRSSSSPFDTLILPLEPTVASSHPLTDFT